MIYNASNIKQRLYETTYVTDTPFPRLGHIPTVLPNSMRACICAIICRKNVSHFARFEDITEISDRHIIPCIERPTTKTVCILKRNGWNQGFLGDNFASWASESTRPIARCHSFLEVSSFWIGASIVQCNNIHFCHGNNPQRLKSGQPFLISSECRAMHCFQRRSGFKSS